MIGRTWFVLHWPRELTADMASAALIGLHGLSTPRRRDTILLRAVGSSQGIEHRIGLPPGRAAAIVTRLRQAVPGLGLEPADPPVPEPSAGETWSVWMSTRTRPLRVSDPEVISGGIAAALSAVRQEESLDLTWIIGPVRRPMATASRNPTDHGSSPSLVVRALSVGTMDLDGEARAALLKKQGEPGWRAAGRVTAHARSTERRRQLLQALSGALRSAQGPGAEIGCHLQGMPDVRRVPWRRPLSLNVPELVGLAWPVGNLDGLPILRSPSRLMAPAQPVPSKGRVLGEATSPGHKRPIAISMADSLSGMWVIGPTGAGKTELMAALAAIDMRAGRSVVVIDVKGDLCDRILGQVPTNRQEDIVLLDVSDSSRPVGFNPLSRASKNPELVADQLHSVLKAQSAGAWGVRISDVIHAAALTLAQQPDPTLVALPLLLSNVRYRHRALARIDDPFGLQPFWASFDALSGHEREQTIAPVMRRLRQLLLRPQMPVVLGQIHPRFDIHEVLTRRRILLVNLARGLVGPSASSLMGSLVVARLWQELLGRADVPPDKRHPISIFIDEVQEHVHGVTDVADMFAMARSHGGALHVAHQHLGQLPADLRTALATNARSRVVFQTSADDAAFFSRGQRALNPEDFQRLPRYEAYASLLTEGQVMPYASLRTRALPAPVADPETLRQLSRQRFGVDRDEVETELRALLEPEPSPDVTPIGQRRRRS